MSLLEKVRENKANCEALREKGLLSPDEVEILEELGVLEPKNELGRG